MGYDLGEPIPQRYAPNRKAALPHEFKPSSQSIGPTDEVNTKIQYLKKAVDLLESHMRDKQTPPPWVVDRINQAAIAMGMAVSYVNFAQQQKFKSASEPVVEPVQAQAPSKRKKS